MINSLLINSNKIMLTLLYLGGFSILTGTVSLIMLVLKRKKSYYRTSLTSLLFLVFVCIAFYAHNNFNEITVYPAAYKNRKFEWITVKDLILNYDSLQNGDVLVKSRGKKLINSAGHVYIYNNGKFVSFNKIGADNIEVLTFEDLYNRSDEMFRKFKTVDKYVILRPPKELDIAKYGNLLDEISVKPYKAISLQKDTDRYNCSTFVYRMLEMDKQLPKRSYFVTAPYDFLKFPELNVVKTNVRYTGTDEFFEIFELIDTALSYDIKLNFTYSTDKGIKLDDNGVRFLDILAEHGIDTIMYEDFR